MNVKDAVAKQFQQLCKEQKIKINELASISGVTPSTAYSMMYPSRRDVSIVTIKNSVTAWALLLGSSSQPPSLMPWSRK